MSAMFPVVDSTIRAALSVEDKALLVQIPELMESVDPGGDDPAHAVLNRDAYRQDDQASQEYASMVRSQRQRDLGKDLDVLIELTSVDPVLTVDDARAVLRAINAARLTLAARSGAFEEGSSWEHRVSEDPALAAVAWLGYVQSELIAAITKCARATG